MKAIVLLQPGVNNLKMMYIRNHVVLLTFISVAPGTRHVEKRLSEVGFIGHIDGVLGIKF